MIFKELVDAYKCSEISKRLRKLYPKDARRSMRKFKKVYRELTVLKPKNNEEEIKLVIDLVKDPKQDWFDVSGEKEGQSMLIGLGFTPWEEWLGMVIHQRTFDLCSHLDIIVHCLWDMTYYGFTQEKIKKFKNEFNKKES